MSDIDREQAALREAAAESRSHYEPEQESALKELVAQKIIAGVSIPAIVVPVLMAWDALSAAGLSWVAASVLGGGAGLGLSAYRAGLKAGFQKLDKQR